MMTNSELFFLRAKTVLARLFSVSSIFNVNSLYPVHRINPSRQEDVITSGEEEGQVVLSAAFRDVSTSSELNYTADIDGFFAHAAVLDVYRALKAPFMLKLRSTPENMVSTHHLVYNNNKEFLDVRRCINIKLGYIKTAIGEADVYLTLSRLPNENMPSIEEIVNYIYSIKTAVTSSPAINIKKDASVPTDSSKTCVLVGGVVNRDNLQDFFILINSVCINASVFMYITSFDIKSQTTTAGDSYYTVIEKLNESITVGELPTLNYDICVSVNTDVGTITVPKDSFFNKLRVKPTHQLFFSNRFAHHNKMAIYSSSKTAALRYDNKFYLKLNCYSKVEDVLEKQRHRRFVPIYTRQPYERHYMVIKSAIVLSALKSLKQKLSTIISR
ncbi:hypothetical protein PAEPH01_1580 [Pancytospora epiphaga]|nr:hypothetical protein PAEPH01_1580 [Pancytospora epiphaga]